MPRTRLFPDPTHPIHLTARSTNRDWFAIPLNDAWEIMELHLAFAARAYRLQIHSFVLMSNHFHLLATAPEGNLSECMRHFMTETSRELLRRCRRINQIYGARYHRSSITNSLYFRHAYKYVYRNPVKAGLCSKVEEYPFSTLHGLLGQKPIYIPMVEDTILFDGDPVETLNWLNADPAEKDWSQVRLALRKGSFKLSRENGRPCHLEIDML